MDDIVSLIYTIIYNVAKVVIHMLANVVNQLDARSSGLSIFW